MKKTMIILIAGLLVIHIFGGSAVAQEQGTDIHGFISTGYLATTENYFSDIGEGVDFIYDDIGLTFNNALTDNLRVGIQLYSREFNDDSSNDVKVDWAVADYRFRNWLGLRVGQMKMPHGLYNEIRDIDMLRNPIFLPESVYQELSHDLYANDVLLTLIGINSREFFLSLQGAGIYGFLDLDALGALSYQMMYGTQKFATGKPRTFEKASAGLMSVLQDGSLDVDYKYAGNMVWETPFRGLRLGLSLDNIKMTATANINYLDIDLGQASVDYKRMENWVASAEFSWENLIIMGEYMFSRHEYKFNIPSNIPPESKLESKTIENQPTGWYVGGAYRVWDWFEVGGYYSRTDGDNDDYYPYKTMDDNVPHPEFFHELNDIAATLRFDINEFWTLKLEAHRTNAKYTAVTAPNPDEPFDLIFTPTEEDWSLYTARMTVAF